MARLFDGMMGTAAGVLGEVLGLAAVYVDPGGTAVPLTVLRKDAAAAEEDGAGRVDRDRCVLIGSGVEVQMAGAFEIEGESWAVEQILHRRGDRFEVQCVRKTPAEVSRPGYRKQ